MAVAIRGTTPATTITVSDPISVSLTGTRQPNTGDVLLIIHCNDFYALSNMSTPTVGGSSTGVTAVTGGSADSGASEAHAIAYTYVVTSTGDATVAVDETGTADEEKGLIVYVLSGVDTANPIDVAGNAIDTGTTTHICPSVSPSSSDAFLICHANPGPFTTDTTYTPPGGMTETYDTASGFHIGGAVEQLSASGATGTRTFVPNTASVANQAMLSIAIKTASAAAADSSAYSIARLPGRIGPDGKVFTPGIRFDNNGAAAATQAPAGGAEGTASAFPAVAALGTTPTTATASGSALQATVSTSSGTNAPAGLASVSGTAFAPTIAVGALPTAPAAAGAAGQPAVAERVNAGAATATSTGLQATAAVRPSAGAASGTGSALQASTAIRANTGVATANGLAHQPTVSISGSANAPAGVASATGTAFSPQARVAPVAATATATGIALAGRATLTVNPATATAESTGLGVAGPIQPVTPETRIYAIPADPRELEIRADNRTHGIPADPRQFQVPADTRTHQIPADARTLTVPGEA